MTNHAMKTAVVVGILSLAAAMAPSPAAANKACTDDKAKFCSDVDSKDRKAMKACLHTHYSDLSAGCQKEVDHWKKGSTQSSTSGSVNGGDQGGSNTSPTGAPDSSSSSH